MRSLIFLTFLIGVNAPYAPEDLHPVNNDKDWGSPCYSLQDPVLIRPDAICNAEGSILNVLEASSQLGWTEVDDKLTFNVCRDTCLANQSTCGSFSLEVQAPILLDSDEVDQASVKPTLHCVLYPRTLSQAFFKYDNNTNTTFSDGDCYIDNCGDKCNPRDLFCDHECNPPDPGAPDSASFESSFDCGRCINPFTDNQNCGRCGRVCDKGQHCEFGSCLRDFSVTAEAPATPTAPPPVSKANPFSCPTQDECKNLTGINGLDCWCSESVTSGNVCGSSDSCGDQTCRTDNDCVKIDPNRPVCAWDPHCNRGLKSCINVAHCTANATTASSLEAPTSTSSINTTSPHRRRWFWMVS